MYKPTESEFLNRVEKHELTILRDDGLYRHLRFRATGTGIDGFDIVTWPGSLCYTGDMGTFVFQRTEDMMSFFRGNVIASTYWSENVVAQDREGVKQFDVETAKAAIRRWVPEDASEGLEAAVEELIDRIPWEECGEETVRCEVEEFSYREPGEDHPHDGWYFADFGEADLTVFTYRFIFCCRALSWGVRKYDEAKR